MLRTHKPVFVLACFLIAILPGSRVLGGPGTGNGQEPVGAAPAPPRVVAVGDIHGAYDAFVGLMQAAGILDDTLSWVGGDTIFVQTGDFTDRGPGVRPVIDLMRRMQLEAEAAGGQVLVALGNHEIMNLIGEVRDVTPEIMLSFAGDDAVDVRDAGYKEVEDRILRAEGAWARLSPRDRRRVKENWIADHPLGYVEYIRALGPEADYGRWLRSLPFGVVVQDILFLHAGVAPELGPWGVDGLNERVAQEIEAFDAYRIWLQEEKRITSFPNLKEIITGAARETRGIEWLEAREAPLGEPPALHDDLAAVGGDRLRFQSLFFLDEWFLNAPRGPLWLREYARWSEPQGTALMTELVRTLGVRAVVVGHTPQRNGIRARFGSRVFLIDTGMLAAVYQGEAMALEIDGEEWHVIHADGRRTLLPSPPPLAAGARVAGDGS